MSLRQKTIAGLSWSAVAQGGKQLSQFIITVILARLLAPTDFGLLGMAMVFTGFIAIFSELGLSGALIQKQNADEGHYSSAFWLNVLVGVVLTIGFIFAAPVIAAFYRRPELESILVVLAFNFLLSSFTIVQQAILTKNMDFKALMVRDLAAVIAAGIAGIFFAYRGFGVWSLVIQLFVFTCVNNILLWSCSSWRPKWVFRLESLKDIFHFSSHMTGFQIVNYFARNVDSLLIGRFLGSQALGYYTLAYKLMMFPIQNFTWVLNKVMFPAFSMIQRELEKVRINYLKMIKTVTLIAFPVMAFLFIAAPDLIVLLYGERWKEAVPLVQIFCFCGMIQAIGSSGGVVYLSQGRADVQFKMSVVSIFLLSGTLLFAVRHGVEAVALAYTVYYLLWTQVSLWVVSRLISLNVSRVYKTAMAPFAMSMALLLAAAGFGELISLEPAWKMVIIGTLGIVAYLAFVFLAKQIIILDNRQLTLKEV